MKDKILCLNDYYGSKGVRELAHRAKNNDRESCLKIAKEISERMHFPRNSILVPIPSSSGKATKNLIICEEIAKIIKISVSNCIEGNERNRFYDLKKKSAFIPDDFLGLRKTTEPDPGTIFLFDIVVDTGKTMLEAKKLFENRKVFCLAHSMVDLHKIKENQNIRNSQENNIP